MSPVPYVFFIVPQSHIHPHHDQDGPLENRLLEQELLPLAAAEPVDPVDVHAQKDLRGALFICPFSLNKSHMYVPR